MRRYILNSAVITNPGTYTYTLLTVEQAKDWLAKGGLGPDFIRSNCEIGLLVRLE